ncbi:MAG: tetratricopeptide repeat-containing protein [Anaerolineae bacterium]|nr:MAG: tetratricopeptide repeat-containing protein [Anaerolineae bacterium]
MGNLGISYHRLEQFQEVIAYYQQQLCIARDRRPPRREQRAGQPGAGLRRPGR